MNVNDIGVNLPKRANKAYRSRGVALAPSPVDGLCFDTASAQSIADWTIRVEKDHGEPVATGIPVRGEIKDRVRQAPCIRFSRPQQMNDPRRRAQERSTEDGRLNAVLTRSRTLLP